MSVTFLTNDERIEALYVGYFGRAADPGGLNYWVGQLNSGALTYSQIATSFSVQNEFTVKYALQTPLGIANSGAFIDQIYLDLFNRTADADGKAYWQAQLAATNYSP